MVIRRYVTCHPRAHYALQTHHSNVRLRRVVVIEKMTREYAFESCAQLIQRGLPPWQVTTNTTFQAIFPVFLLPLKKTTLRELRGLSDLKKLDQAD
jgi:hypothetical protein